MALAPASYAAPTFQAAGNQVDGTGNVTPQWPPHQVGDVALLFVVSAGGEAVTLSNAAGFSAVPNSPQSVTAGGNDGTRLTVFWARATSTSMPNPTVADPGNHVYARILTYRGVIGTGNPWDVTGGGVKTGNSATLQLASVTTTVGDTLIVQAASHGRDNAGAHFNNQTNANLVGIAERSDAGTTQGHGGGLGVWDGVKTTAGATGITNVSLSPGVRNAYLTIALKPELRVLSINRNSPNPTLPNTSVSWVVTFSASVTGVDASDFALVQSGGVTGASITSVSGGGTTWTVTANTGTGVTGTLGLNLVDNDSIVSGGRPLGGPGAGNGNFTGQTYTMAPVVLSINRTSANPTSANTSVSWTVTFSASVTGVNASDFSLVQAGGATGASITSVTGSGTTWTVTANTGTGGVGTLGLNLVDDDSIVSGGNPLGGIGAGNGNFTGQVYTLVPKVLSINRASANPAYADGPITWTVTFSASVTGVDASDFVLVMGGGVSGASITSVSGSGTTWTVAADGGTSAGTLGLNLVDNDSIVASGVALGGPGAGNGDAVGQVYTLNAPFCTPPANIPAGITVACVCDTFGRSSLNPSTIYGDNWIVSTSDTTGVVPYINATTGNLRLTENTGNNAKAATVPGIFPAAGNYISVEFKHYSYNGSGADGIAVTLSDYSVPAVPGAFGGSLGYAQKSNPGSDCTTPGGCPGFAGGWIGVALDEYGNYSNPTEGRIGGPGSRPDSVGVRGSGSGTSGYTWLTGSSTLSPGVDNTGSGSPAPGHYYQVIVDARNAGNPTPQTFVAVNRDTTGTGASYATVIPSFDVFAINPSQAPVPTNWQISFTGSTGGLTNIHEIGGLRICAQTVAPPTGGTATGFAVVDEFYGTPPSGPAVQNFLNGHIFTKLVGTPFRLNVAALDDNQIVTTYALGGPISVTLRLVDNSDNACVLNAASPNYCNATCRAKPAVSGGSQVLTFTSSDAGKKQSANFTLNTAYRNLVAIVSDGTTTACSTDAFSVRPTGISSVTSTATNGGTAGTPFFRAGADQFTLTATIPGVAGNPNGYSGTLKIDNNAVQIVAPATNAGTIAPTTFGAAVSGTPNATATGSTFTFSEVGHFRLRGYNPATNTTSARGVYDGVMTTTECSGLTATQCDTLKAATWTGVDSISTRDDCVQNSYSNTRVNGKYGCLFGLTSDSATMGRFTPAYFDLALSYGCSTGGFTYSGQPFQVSASAFNGAGSPTLNYQGALAKNVTISINGGSTAEFNGTNTILSTSFVNGVGTNTGVTYTFPVKETAALVPSTPPAVPTTPLRGVDVDGISSLNHAEPQIEVRSGRIAIQNAFGSELVDLAVPMHVQHYVDSNTGWVTNTDDTCTTVTMAPFIDVDAGDGLVPAETCIQDIGSPGRSGSAPTTCAAAAPVARQFREGGVAGFNGDFNLYLRAPGAGNTGSLDVTLDLSATPWLRYNWDGIAGEESPIGRATFGLYRGSPRHIYLRER